VKISKSSEKNAIDKKSEHTTYLYLISAGDETRNAFPETLVV
jgi:hypothetical protein